MRDIFFDLLFKTDGSVDPLSPLGSRLVATARESNYSQSDIYRAALQLDLNLSFETGELQHLLAL